MAGSDTQQQLLSLIRDFTSEKSRGEQRVVGLKKRFEALKSEVEAANAELEQAKRNKEVAEEELNGYEVELSLNNATIQSLEARISLRQDEISVVGNEVNALKNKEGLLRDQFINQMFELNKEIRFPKSPAFASYAKETRLSCFPVNREFQKAVVSSVGNDDGTGTKADDRVFEDDYGADSETIKDILSDVNSEIAKEEEEYLVEENIQKQLQKELNEHAKRMSLMEGITDKTKSLQALSSSELEQTLASLGEELQKRCRCQHCQAENLEVLSFLLQDDQVC